MSFIEQLKTDAIADYDEMQKDGRKNFTERLEELCGNPDWVEFLNQQSCRAMKYFKEEIEKVCKEKAKEVKGATIELDLLKKDLQSCAKFILSVLRDRLMVWLENNTKCKNDADKLISGAVARSITKAVLFKFGKTVTRIEED